MRYGKEPQLPISTEGPVPEMRGLIVTGAAIASLTVASPAAAKLSGSWSPIIKGPMAGNRVNCVTFRGFEDGSILMLQGDREKAQRGELLIKLINPNWSIRATDELPEMTFRDTNGSGITGVPIAVDHGMVFHIGIGPLIGWADTLDGEPIVLMREHEPLARLDTNGLANAIRGIRDCGQKAFVQRQTPTKRPGRRN